VDRILIVDNEVILEEGTYRELMEKESDQQCVTLKNARSSFNRVVFQL